MASEETKKQKPKRPTPEKRELQNEKKRMRNRFVKATLRTAIKKYQEAVSSKENDSINVKLNEVYSLVDKAVKKGTIKKNTANRTKSRLAVFSQK